MEKFQKLISSDDFTLKWSSFLEQLQLHDEPLFYQVLTDELFNQLLKKWLVPSADLGETEECLELTFEENAIRYVGGYVVRKLRE